MNQSGRRPNSNRASGRGRGRRRGPRLQVNLPTRAPSSAAPNTLSTQPNMYPIVCVTRMIDGAFNVVCDGTNPSFAAFNFSLNDVPGYTEFTAIFSTYCIEQVEVWLRPEYTVLSDASALSNSVNVDLFSAIDLVDGTAPTAVSDVEQYQSCAHTSIVYNHYRKIRPAWLVDSIGPTCMRVSTASPSINWYGLKVAVPPTGVAMTFRSVVKYKLVFTGLK